MRSMLAVRRLEAEDVPAAVAVVEGSPDYFTEDVPGHVQRDAVEHDAWVVAESDHVLGFAIVARKSASAAEILWIAIDGAHRGRGHGTLLLGHVLDQLGTSGVSLVEAKTLDASAGYPPYEATRAFWERHGFVQIDTIDPLPGWPPGNPAAIYVAAIRATR
jgi:GNAT superfamily N-acetyltransferase